MSDATAAFALLLRKHQKKSVKVLCGELGVKKDRLTKWLSNLYPQFPPEDMLLQISQLFEIPFEEVKRAYHESKGAILRNKEVRKSLRRKPKGSSAANFSGAPGGAIGSTSRR